MTLTVPPSIKEVIQVLKNAGFQVFLVGGPVRNLLLKKPVKDWDLRRMPSLRRSSSFSLMPFMTMLFGTVGIPVNKDTPDQTVIEVTTFRTEQGYSDRRHPDSVSWGKTIEEDLARRDFTVNAMAIALTTNYQLPTANIIDPFNGRQDLEDKLIRAVGDPNERFKEDALRLMRAIRFATQLSFSIEQDTLASITRMPPPQTHCL